ncbi:unnamed protein product [Adineta steineri]|uniref:Uncharacterized protein n=1 Tax=Adineta steineri TaxID=433720 RepID=A0A815GG73_9BILA|nr:unnamed protein product [Adineta steineri]CAF3949257.1 unnamed protein product [Adineta steineri]
MATTVLRNDGFYTNTVDKSLEIFSLIWLDANINVKETRDTEQKLRSIINHIKKFQDIKKCRQYIEQTSQKDRLVIIVSGRLGREIVPSIHQLRQVISIYIYCIDKESHEQWAYKFTKIKSIVVDLDELVSQIIADHQIQKKVEEPLSINIFATNVDAEKSMIEVNGQFVFFQILIDCLLRLKSTEIDKNELIKLCENEYKGNQTELNNFREFEKYYSRNNVLLWYTKETFFYKTLNAALRTQNIHMIFLFRAFIYDIYLQLQQCQSKYPLQVYRSQLISNDELNSLRQNIGQFISVNSFFSTSDERPTALLLLLRDITTKSDLERVLFEIDADPNIVTTKPFANISEHSYFPNESEILFMIGSIFRLDNIYRKDDQLWIIKMTLCNDDEHDLKQALMYMKQQINNEETDLQTLGKLLWEMGKIDLTEKYFNRLLQELSLNDPLHISLYEDLGKLASQRGDYHMSMKWRQKLLTFKEENPSASNVSVNKINNSIKQSILFNHININTTWKQHGITIAGGNGPGSQLNQLYLPQSIYVDDDHQTIYIADCYNHRVVEWKYGKKTGQIVAGGNGNGNQSDQLNDPRDVIVDKKNDSLIISDYGNRRVVRWSRQNGTNGETIISDIDCRGLTIDKNGDLYVSDIEKDEVRRYKQGETEGTIVAGGHGKGNHLNQLDCPTYIFVDEHHSVYVSDCLNHRVMKWMKDAKEGIVVAGGKGKGNSLTQLSYPHGVVIDHLGNAYVTDSNNYRIMRWCEGSCEGSIVVGGNGEGEQPNQFSYPTGLSFNVQGNLYVVDIDNCRIQRFDIDSEFNLYEDRGKLASRTSDYDMSIQWRQKSLVFKEQNQLTTNSNIDEANNLIASVEKSPTYKPHYNNPPIVYVVDLELPPIDWDLNIAQLEKYNVDNQLADIIRELNLNIPFYILSSMPPSDEIMSYVQLLRYYHLQTSPDEHAKTDLNINDRVISIDSIDHFVSELFEDLGQYYRDEAEKALFDHQDREEAKQLLTKSEKCFEILERDIQKTLKRYENLPKT